MHRVLSATHPVTVAYKTRQSNHERIRIIERKNAQRRVLRSVLSSYMENL